MKATIDRPRSRAPRTKGTSAAACSKGSPPRRVTPSTWSRARSRRASRTPASTGVPAAGSNMWGLQQPGQRMAQPWSHTAKRAPGPSASVTSTTAATRIGGIPGHSTSPHPAPRSTLDLPPPVRDRAAPLRPAAAPPAGGSLVPDPQHRPRREGREHHPHARRRRRAEGEQRPPRHAHGRGRHGLRALDAPPALRPVGAALDRPGPLRPLGGPRVDAPLLAPAPGRLRPLRRRPQELPPGRLPHPRPPRVRPHSGRRGHERPARPGIRQRGGHGAGPGHALGPARAGEPRRGSLGLRHRLRRRPHGGSGRRGGQLRRPQPAGPAHLPLRRQRDHHRRAHQPGLLGRGRHPPLRGAGLAGPERGRPRPRRDLEGHRRLPRGTSPAPASSASAPPSATAHRTSRASRACTARRSARRS